MGDPKGLLVVPIGFNPSDELRSFELDASDNLKIALMSAAGSDLLTELQQKLETADLELDASGALKVIFKSQDVDVEVKQQTPGDLRVGDHGYFSSAWQKNPLLLGYSDRGEEALSNLSASAGNNTLNGATVPAGEIWNLQAVVAFNNTSACTYIRYGVATPTTAHYLKSVKAPSAKQYVTWSGSIIMKAGDYMYHLFEGCTLNDDLYARYLYVRIDIDQ